MTSGTLPPPRRPRAYAHPGDTIPCEVCKKNEATMVGKCGRLVCFDCFESGWNAWINNHEEETMSEDTTNEEPEVEPTEEDGNDSAEEPEVEEESEAEEEAELEAEEAKAIEEEMKPLVRERINPERWRRLVDSHGGVDALEHTKVVGDPITNPNTGEILRNQSGRTQTFEYFLEGKLIAAREFDGSEWKYYKFTRGVPERE